MARKYGKKKMWQTVGAIAVAVVVCVGAAAGIGALVNQDDDGFEKVSVSWDIGGLNDDGKYEESEATLYTKEGFDVEGKTVYADIDFDAQITYQLYFYDEDDTYIEGSATGVLTEDYKAVAPENAVTCRVKITPIWDEDTEKDDQKVTVFNKGGFADQLKLQVSEEVEEAEEDSSSEA